MVLCYRFSSDTYTKTRTRLLCAMLAMLLAAGPGCIPVGTEVLKRDVQKTVPREKKNLLSTTLKPNFDEESGLLRVQLMGTFNVEAWEDVTVTCKKRHKYLVIGVAPGLFATWVGGVDCKGKKLTQGRAIGEAIFIWPLAAGLTNAILIGLPTIIPWFSEAGEDWTPPVLSAKRSSRGGIVWASLIGYAKTCRKETVTETEQTDVRTTRVEEGLANVRVVLSIPKLGFETMGMTNTSGTADFALRGLPIITSVPLDVRVAASSVSSPPSAATVSISPSAFGQGMFTMLLDPLTVRWNTIYIEGQTVDFSLVEGVKGAKAEVKIRIVAPTADAPDEVRITATVRNSGTGTLHRLVGRTRCPLEERLSNHLFVFGRIAPGQTVSRTVSIPLTEVDMKQRHIVQLVFTEANACQIRPVQFTLDCPLFARLVARSKATGR